MTKSTLRRITYRAEKKSLQILLSSSQARPGRKVKQKQEEISRNHVPRLFLRSVVRFVLLSLSEYDTNTTSIIKVLTNQITVYKQDK